MLFKLMKKWEKIVYEFDVSLVLIFLWVKNAIE